MKWIALIALSLSLKLGFSQSLSETYSLAQSQLVSNNYKAAILSFERVIFFDDNNQYSKAAYYKIASCYLALDQPNKQLKAYDKAIVFAKNDSAKTELTLEKVYFLLQYRYWNKALQELYAIKPSNKNQEQLLNYYLGAVLFATDQFVQSEFYFQKITTNASDSLAVENIFAKAKKKLNPQRAIWAKRISFIVPGSGQIAAGNIKSGLNSIGLISGLGLLYLRTVQNYGLLSGMVSILPWLSRYHIGGAENAEESMLSRQEKLKSQYFDELVELVR